MIFIIIFSLVLSILYFYVGWKFIFKSNISRFSKNILSIILLLFYLFPIFGFLLHFLKIENSFSILFLWLGYIGLGIVSLLFFSYLIIDIFSIISHLLLKENKFDPNRRIFLGFTIRGLAATISGIGSAWGIYSALKTPVIKTVKIPIINLSNNLNNFKIAHITDTHIGSMIGKQFVQEIVRKISDMKPDILVFTGDAADGSVESYGNSFSPFEDLNVPYGKYFVTGNHEYYSDLNGWLRLIEKVGFKILINESQILNINGSEIMITGIPDKTGKYFSSFHKVDMQKAIGGMRKCDLKILLAHRPKDVEYAISNNFHLQLSGHTHGGQYFPFSLLVQLAHPFLKGLHKKENTWVYINQGTGYWGPPMRIGTEPEITEIIIKA